MSKPGNHLPIMMTAYNRPEYMRKSLRSLLNVRGVQKKNVQVVQDDKNKDVAEYLRSYDFIKRAEELSIIYLFERDSSSTKLQIPLTTDEQILKIL